MAAKNRLCQLLGIRYPIVQAPMNWVSGASLVAAVSNAGGLGTLGPNAGSKTITPDVNETGERIRAQIRKIKSLTTKPFAVNIIAGFGEELKFSKRIVEVVIEEKAPVAIVSVGKPETYTKVLKEAGVKVIHAISTARHGQKAQQVGVDAVICEGFESGGHKGFTELTTFTLTPMVVDAVTIPVVTGGGIGDARGVLAAMALGADGVYMGTRFMLTRESETHQSVKDSAIKAKDVCTVSLPKEHMLARDLANNFTKKYLAMKSGGASAQELRKFLEEHGQYHSQCLGNADDAEICCGQVAGLITDLPPAGELVGTLVKNISTNFEKLKGSIADFV